MKMNLTDFSIRLQERSRSYTNTKEQKLADDVSKFFGIPWAEVYFGMLIGSRKIGYEGVLAAFSEAKDSKENRARLFRFLVKKQKKSIWNEKVA